MTVTLSPPTTSSPHELAELRLGRPLTLGERSIDIVGIDQDLKQGKERLHAAIEKEKRRALNAYFRYKRPIKLRVTPEMEAVIRTLYRKGAAYAVKEIHELAGVQVGRSFSEKNEVEKMVGKLNGHLHEYQKKVVHKAVAADIGSYAELAATRAVLQMPGALAVASQIVSGSMFSGIGDVYAGNTGLFGSWTYTAVMDNATCDECEAHDGEEFESWDELESVLPDGGPNPDCYGEGRCRCRGVPSSVSEAGAVLGEPGALPTEGTDIVEGDVIDGQEAEGLAGLGPGQSVVPFTETTDYQAFNEAVGESARPGFLTTHTEEELADGHAFLSEDGKAGFFISASGDLQNVFRNADGVKGAGAAAVQRAVQIGARTLDAYDGFLPGLYEQAGFRVVGRMAWDDAFAPEGWDYAAYGRPDVVFMAHNPTSLEVRTFTDFEKAKAYSFDVSRASEPLGAPPPDEFKLLPTHARQPVSTLTKEEAEIQIKKLQGNIRGLHWHAKQGKPLRADKLAAYEHRIDALKAHIESGAVATPRVVPTVVPTSTTLSPAITESVDAAGAKRLASAGTSFLEKRKVTASAAKAQIQKDLAARLNGVKDFEDSIVKRSAAPVGQAKQLGQFAVGDEVEIPAYPGFRYEITSEPYKDAKGIERVRTKLTSGPPGTNISDHQSLAIAANRTAIPVKKEVRSAGKVFKHEFPRNVSRSSNDMEQVTSALIDKWAGTSADNDAWALAMQQAIKDEFNLAEESLRHFQASSAWGMSQEIYAEHGAALRAFARAQWENTQAKLAADGIDEIVLYRGQGFMLGEHIPGVHTGADVRLQPASSFSTSYTTAASFQRAYGESNAGGGIMIARVPRERIIGSARTGYGCLNENEFVVLGKGAGQTDLMNVEMAEAGNIVYKSVETFLSDMEKAVRGKTPSAVGEIPEDVLFSIVDDLTDVVGEEGLDAIASTDLHFADNLTPTEIENAVLSVAKMPPAVVKKIMPNGFYVGKGGVSNLDQLTHLKGTKWDTTAGAYQDGKVVISADLANAYGTSSANVYLHEFGHAFQEKYGYGKSPVLSTHHKRLADAGKLSPYLRGTAPGSWDGGQELFAEAFAEYVGSGNFGYQQLVAKFDKPFADWFRLVMHDEGVIPVDPSALFG